ncbi:MAG: polyprenyl synthetase family protein, partial [Verrucomicrobiota bacterium]|nr:polyprenyl synthetase family protein [Verrucomicrobiota bacterium]
DITRACEEFGYHLGLAFQIQDDILDFTGTAADLGKPAMADMSLGLSTAMRIISAPASPMTSIWRRVA